VKEKNIALVSMPGGGKSTVARSFAKRLNWQYLDTDVLIEERLGCSIRDFFEAEGEKKFRDLEQQIILSLCATFPTIVATGGGAVLRSENREFLHKNFVVVYLHSTPEELFRRLRHDVKRPLLQVQNPLQKLCELYELRDPLYRETAHFCIDTGRPSVVTLVNMVVTQLKLSGILKTPPE
jgi:shikimate kinase